MCYTGIYLQFFYYDQFIMKLSETEEMSAPAAFSDAFNKQM